MSEKYPRKKHSGESIKTEKMESEMNRAKQKQKTESRKKKE